jgi:uncharacterized phage-associated protein
LIFLPVPRTNTYTTNQIDKLGNAIIFLCQQLHDGSPVSKTHILKLIFILEELSIRNKGIPFFGLKFELWKLGPVSPDLYIELTEEPNLLASFIRVDNNEGRTEVVPISAFSDNEFSDSEMELLEKVAERFKYCTAKELINFTHRKDTPWYLTAQKHGLLEVLEAGKINSTDIEVDLAEAISSDEIKLSLYKANQAFYEFRESINDNRDWWHSMSPGQQEKTLISMEQGSTGKMMAHEEVSRKIWTKINL